MQDYSSIVIPIVREVGKEILPYFGIAPVTHQKTESAIDVVTELDTKAELALKKRLGEAFPNISFMGEEFGGEKSSRMWLCDPIDGTGNFVRGLPFATTMLALIEDGQVIFSAIYDFVRDDMYSASRGGGAWKNGKRTHVSTRSLRESYLSFETNMLDSDNYEKYCNVRNMKASSISTLNAGYEFAMVASGKLDGRIGLNPYGKDWDYAPGSLLVSEAGGVVTNIGKSSYDYTNHDLLAVNPLVYKELTVGMDAPFPLIK